MPLPVALFVVLMLLNLGSGRAEDPPNPPAPESTSGNGDSKQISRANEIGSDCVGVSAIKCTLPLTCIDGVCDCGKPTNLMECYCDLGGGEKYTKWMKDPKDGSCKLAYGHRGCKTKGDTWEMCGPGLKCEKNFCQVSATSVTSPYSVGALVISALVMMVLK